MNAVSELANWHADHLDDRPPAKRSVLQFEGHIIRLVRFEFLIQANCLGAFVVIEPPTSLPAPDIVLGVGPDESQARRDAFTRAQARIENSWTRAAVVA